VDRGIRVLVRRHASLDRRYRYSLLGDDEALGDSKPEETARGGLTEPSRAGYRWIGEYASSSAGMPLSIDGTATRYSVTGHWATSSRRRRLGE